MHKEKLMNVSKAVDNNLPMAYKQRINKSSKEFMIEGRY